MKILKLTLHIVLCVCVVVLNAPQAAQAALFTKKAEAAIIATEAEAQEATYVAPQASSATALFSTGTGFTSLGNDLLSRLQQMFQPTPAEQVAAPAGVTAPVVIDQQTQQDQSGIAVVPLGAEKATVVGAPVVLMGEEKAAVTIEEMIPVVPAEEVVTPEIAPTAEPATEKEEEKALFPLLWGTSGAAAAGAGVEEGAAVGFFSTTGGKALGIGLLLAAIAVGIILPIALSNSGGGGGGGSSSGGDASTNPPTGGSLCPTCGNPLDECTCDDGQKDNGAPIPEPLTLILFGTGLIGLFLRKRND